MNNEPIVLGHVKKGKTGKPLLVLILFLFIGAILFILPTINNYFKGYNILDLIKNGEFISFIQNHEQYENNKNIVKTTATTTTSVEKNEPMLINKKTILEYNNFNINNFILTESSLDYTINTTTNINFDKSNYYLVLTKNNERVIIKLTGEVNGSKSYNFDISNKLSDIIEVTGDIRKINYSDYTNFTLSNDQFGNGKITCQKDFVTINYNFFNNNLINIKETYNYKKNEFEEFDKIYKEYLNLSNNITLSGGTSQMIQTQSGFLQVNTIDLNIYNFTQNINNNYYSLNTQPKVINFEMKAKGYDCK